MMKIACGARTQLGSVILCAFVLLGLSACGADDAASNVTPASASTVSLISPRAGMIDRTPATAGLAGPSSTPGTAAETPPASGSIGGTGSSGSGGTTGNTGGGKTIPPPAPAPTTGTATVDWLPPTQNNDGSTLTNLAGYTLYYGNSPDQLTRSIKVTNPGLTAFTVSDLSPGVWYFAVTSYTAGGIESARSGVVSTTI